MRERVNATMFTASRIAMLVTLLVGAGQGFQNFNGALVVRRAGWSKFSSPHRSLLSLHSKLWASVSVQPLSSEVVVALESLAATTLALLAGDEVQAAALAGGVEQKRETVAFPEIVVAWLALEH